MRACAQPAVPSTAVQDADLWLTTRVVTATVIDGRGALMGLRCRGSRAGSGRCDASALPRPARRPGQPGAR